MATATPATAGASPTRSMSECRAGPGVHGTESSCGQTSELMLAAVRRFACLLTLPGRGVPSPLSERMRPLGASGAAERSRISHFLGAPPQGSPRKSLLPGLQPLLPGDFQAPLRSPGSSDFEHRTALGRGEAGPSPPCSPHQNTTLVCMSHSQEPGEGLRELGQESTDTLSKEDGCPLPCSRRAVASPAPFLQALISPGD